MYKRQQEGIIATIGDKFYGYTPVSVDGMDRCIEILNALRNGEVDHVFVEANICPGSCVGGPIMRMHRKSVVRSEVTLSGEKIPLDDSPAKSAAVQMTLSLIHI